MLASTDTKCLHCGHPNATTQGFYMLQGDLWEMIHPAGRGDYFSGYICLPCALESIDRVLYLGDITGGVPDDLPWLPERVPGLDCRLVLPQRPCRPQDYHPIVRLTEYDNYVDERHPMDILEDEYPWLLDRLALHARVIGIQYDGDPDVEWFSLNTEGDE